MAAGCPGHIKGSTWKFRTASHGPWSWHWARSQNHFCPYKSAGSSSSFFCLDSNWCVLLPAAASVADLPPQWSREKAHAPVRAPSLCAYEGIFWLIFGDKRQQNVCLAGPWDKTPLTSHCSFCRWKNCSWILCDSGFLWNPHSFPFDPQETLVQKSWSSWWY